MSQQIIRQELNIRDRIIFRGKKYRVTAKDLESGNHPGGFKKWDYILDCEEECEESQKEIRILAEKLEKEGYQNANA